MIAKCIQYFHFRLHMYANNTRFNCTIQNDKPCVDDVHEYPKMNTTSIFGSHGMDGGDTIAFFI